MFDVVPRAKGAYITRNDDKLAHFKVKYNYFKNYLYPLTVIESNICNSDTGFKGTSFKVSKILDASTKKLLDTRKLVDTSFKGY